MSIAPAITRSGGDSLRLILAAASWGLGTVVSKRALDDLPAVYLLPIQLAASVVVLVVLMRSRGIALRGAPVLLGRLGILNPGIAYALGLLGLASITASLSVLIWATEPILIVALAAVVLREPLTRTFVLLSTLAVGGMLLVLYDPAIGGQLVGVLLAIAGVACCALYTVLARRWFRGPDSTVQVVLAQQVHALAFAAVAALALTAAGAATPPSVGPAPVAIASAVASGVLYYAAAYWLYLGALRNVPAATAAASFYLIPLFGIAAAFVLLGERLEPGAWIGGGIVVAAVIAILRRPIGQPLPSTS